MFKGNLGDLMRQAQEMGQNLKAKQEELAQKTYEVAVGGGMVTMRFNGKGEALSIKIDPALVDPDELQMLEDLVLSAVNQGIKESQSALQEEMSKLAGGMKIPGFTA